MRTKQVRLPLEVACQIEKIEDMEERGALIERALLAPPEPSGEVVGPVALPEPVAELAGDSSGESPAGSASVSPKSFWSTGRNGLGERVEWPGAVVHLPQDCSWFLSLDDASRADAVRRALSRCREVVAEREELGESVINPEGHVRPKHIPESWEPVPVWVPAREACYPATIQDIVAVGLGVEKQMLYFDLKPKKTAEGQA